MNEHAAGRLATFRNSLDARETELLGEARRAASQSLTARPDAERILESVASTLELAARALRHHLAVLQPSEQIACHAGCHWCCHLKVSATAPEVFAISEYLRHKVPHNEREVIQARAARTAKDPRIFSEDAKAFARIPCVLLTAAGTCAVYSVRPLACRGWTSTDPEACQRALDSDEVYIPTHERLARDCAALSLALLDASAAASLPTELLELTSALDIALREPNAMQRWMAGEPIFAEILTAEARAAGDA